MSPSLSSSKSGQVKKIMFLTGAGVSVGAGIPDFRSPGGMYDTLRPEVRSPGSRTHDGPKEARLMDHMRLRNAVCSCRLLWAGLLLPVC